MAEGEENLRLNSQPGHTVESALAYNGLLWTMVSLAEALWILLAREGLYTPRLLVPGCCGIFMASAFVPFLLPERVRRRISEDLFIYPLLSLLVLGSVLFLWTLRQYGIYFYSLLGVIGLIRSGFWLKEIKIFQWLFLLILAGLVSSYLFLFLSPLNYANAFAPELALLGRIRKDSYYATVIAHMIQNYGTVSTGLDGLVRLHYHTGSHSWFAMLGRMTGQAPLMTYPSGLFLILLPMQFYALVLSGICVGKNRLKLRDYLGTGLVLVYLTDALGRPSHYVSESFGSALTCLLLMMPLLIKLSQRLKPGTKSEHLLWLLALVLIFPLNSLKISAGIIWSASLGYLLLRRYGISIKSLGYGILVLGLELFSFSIFNDPGQKAILAPLKFFATHPRILFLTSWLIPALAFLAFWFKFELKNWKELKALFLEKKTLELEVLLLSAIIGALPALLLWVSNAWAWFFFNVVQWMAFPVLFHYLSWDHLRRIKEHKLLLLLLLALALPISYKSFLHTRSVFRVNYLKKHREFLEELSAHKKISHPAPPNDLYGSELSGLLAEAPGYQAYSLVLKASRGKGREFAVFVPPENQEFWKMMKNCVSIPMFIPSVTGKLMLMGLSPKELNCPLRFYGYPDYPPDAHSREIDDSSLCHRAREKGIQEVFILKDLSRTDQNRILDCATKSPEQGENPKTNSEKEKP